MLQRPRNLPASVSPESLSLSLSLSHRRVHGRVRTYTLTHTHTQYEPPLTWTLPQPRILPASEPPEFPVHPGKTSRDLRICRKSHRHYGNNKLLVKANSTMSHHAKWCSF